MSARGEREGDWLSMRRDAESGIETIRAHFKGHAYELHDHDDVLVGVTEQGVQEFRCRRRLHTSTPGRAILIEPGELHDGHSPRDAGFTYAMLYLPQRLVAARLEALRGAGMPSATDLGFRDTLADDPVLARTIHAAFLAVHGAEGRLARDLAVDRLVARLAGHAAAPRPATARRPQPAASRAREALHARMAEDVGLDDLAGVAGTDRFRLNRAFREAFGLSPHAYLVRLRLKAARRMLAAGEAPAAVAAGVGFADQSHLGRWFRRAYGMTPAAYRRICTNVPD
ncbi:AraC family transcriptional regulator [Azospirillum agricola]|uniref:AraC family transcriptional regulator n=1 Tax=Azospirillum agricola TaxID=1720247 RepID=UPI000A0EEBAE|nr:AraC family transcriptional regulator [Azospirillum agricola]SMH31497.1 transcriptional regulator, AraC family [Azospirillum lipoferum]